MATKKSFGYPFSLKWSFLLHGIFGFREIERFLGVIDLIMLLGDVNLYMTSFFLLMELGIVIGQSSWLRLIAFLSLVSK